MTQEATTDATTTSKSWSPLRQPCLGCLSVYDPTSEPDPGCVHCEGTGNLRYVPWAHSAWSEVVPYLWVGAHRYARDVSGYACVDVTPESLALAQFDVVVSLYRENCDPPATVEHHEFLFEDDPRFPLVGEPLEKVHALATLVREAVEARRKVLVRCHAGMNRSSLVAALALIQMGRTPQSAIELIRLNRTRFALFNPRYVEVIHAQEAPVV